MMAAIKNLFTAIGDVFSFLLYREKLNNAPDVKAAAQGQQDANAQAKFEKDIATGDVKEMEKDIAE